MISTFLTIVLLLGGMAQAQTEHHEGSHSMLKEEAPANYPCPMLRAHHEQMTQKMALMDKKVDQLVSEMKGAQGDQKIKVMESLLATLVEQRASIHKEMISMMPKMMEYVARHSGGESHECTHKESIANTSGY